LRRGLAPGRRALLLARGPAAVRNGRRPRGPSHHHAARAADVRPGARRAGARPDAPRLPSVLVAHPGLAEPRARARRAGRDRPAGRAARADQPALPLQQPQLDRPADPHRPRQGRGLRRGPGGDAPRMTNYTLRELEERLDPEMFFRAHKSTLGNLKHVHEIQPWFGDRYRLVMRDQARSEVSLSRVQVRALRARLRRYTTPARDRARGVWRPASGSRRWRTAS